MVRRATAALLACALASTAQAECRQALALGLDVSGSVDSAEYRLQLDGLAAALEHPDVQAALLAMPATPVSLLVYEWSGPAHQRLLLDWTVVTDGRALAAITARLRATRRTRGDPSTALGAAIRTGVMHLRRRADCDSRTLDISGDGKSNSGPHPRDVGSDAVTEGILINGLVIGPDAAAATDARQMQVGELAAYYTAYVIAGPGSFVETATGFADYEAAMARKLLRELQGLVVSSLPGPPVLRQ